MTRQPGDPMTEADVTDAEWGTWDQARRNAGQAVLRAIANGAKPVMQVRSTRQTLLAEVWATDLGGTFNGWVIGLADTLWDYDNDSGLPSPTLDELRRRHGRKYPLGSGMQVYRLPDVPPHLYGWCPELQRRIRFHISVVTNAWLEGKKVVVVDGT